MELEDAINTRPVLTTSGGPGVFHHKGLMNSGGSNNNIGGVNGLNS